MRAGISCEERRDRKSLIRAARRSVEDMQYERREMVKRNAPIATIEAIDCRIDNALRLMREVTKDDLF